MIINEFFPVVVGVAENKDHKQEEKKLIKYCKKIKTKKPIGGENWIANIYNTSGTHNVHQDNTFLNINKFVQKQLNIYASKIGYQGRQISCTDSWFNIYKKHNYQEYHEHFPADISAVYFLTGDKTTGNLIFKSHEPVSTFQAYHPDNRYTWTIQSIEPNPGKLVLFKSNLLHKVTQNLTNNLRITLAYNFKVS
jgi:uncharacterized protein (TIGR02466 family)|tara:strand:+ start:332 stop:913 length:582 start_codon:yes stop_codon:yes gene_type:complete